MIKVIFFFQWLGYAACFGRKVRIIFSGAFQEIFPAGLYKRASPTFCASFCLRAATIHSCIRPYCNLGNKVKFLNPVRRILPSPFRPIFSPTRRFYLEFVLSSYNRPTYWKPPQPYTRSLLYFPVHKSSFETWKLQFTDFTLYIRISFDF